MEKHIWIMFVKTLVKPLNISEFMITYWFIFILKGKIIWILALFLQLFVMFLYFVVFY